MMLTIENILSQSHSKTKKIRMKFLNLNIKMLITFSAKSCKTWTMKVEVKQLLMTHYK